MRMLLIANRGEIACRIARTARRMGIRVAAVFSEADANAQHVRAADIAFPIGPARAADSYLRADRILDAARQAQADAIHPGYGFLSENAEFAQACADAGIVFIGPPASAIRAMGSKAESKRLMVEAGVPVVPGYHGEDQSDARLADEAARVGFPVLIKASAGGGGKGMRPARSVGEFQRELEGARREAKAAFGDDRVLLERYLQRPRHVEVQVFADMHGHTIHLHTRDCSVQRRHQKVLEEAPAPDLPDALRARLHDAAIAAARAVSYVSAGTVEFIVEGDDAFFMEMNTRLQVEHPVTEAITGLDLVEWQLRVAAGQALPLREAPAPQGHAVEVRLYAEDPGQDYRPSTGGLRRFRTPPPIDGLRVDTGVVEGDAVTPFYDPMIAKVIAHGDDRDAALARLGAALAAIEVAGPTTNLDFLRRLVAHPALGSGELDTGFAVRHAGDLVPKPIAAPANILAAAVALRLLQEAPSADPWSRSDGWRLAGSAEIALALEDATGRRDVIARLQRGALGVEADGAVFAATLLGDAMVVIDGVAHAITLANDGDRWTLQMGGTAWALRWLDPLAPPADAAVATGRLTAPIPGRVVQVLVAVGDAVTQNQTLLVLEAMKTEIRIAAPREGIVTALRCVVGDSVDEGAELIELGPG